MVRSRCEPHKEEPPTPEREAFPAGFLPPGTAVMMPSCGLSTKPQPSKKTSERGIVPSVHPNTSPPPLRPSPGYRATSLQIVVQYLLHPDPPPPRPCTLAGPLPRLAGQSGSKDADNDNDEPPVSPTGGEAGSSTSSSTPFELIRRSSWNRGRISLTNSLKTLVSPNQVKKKSTHVHLL